MMVGCRITAAARKPPLCAAASGGLELGGNKNKIIFSYINIMTAVTIGDVCHQFPAFRICPGCRFFAKF